MDAKDVLKAVLIEFGNPVDEIMLKHCFYEIAIIAMDLFAEIKLNEYKEQQNKSCFHLSKFEKINP